MRPTRFTHDFHCGRSYLKHPDLLFCQKMTQNTVELNLSYNKTWISGLIVILHLSATVIACPELECAPIISRCQLTDACRCDTSYNSTCRLTCSHCLGELFADCCSCVGICPKEVDDDENLGSHVRSFESMNEELFELFAADEDPTERWDIHTFPVTTANSTTNCTMAFISVCVNMYNCESSCISMGASGYRWFHNGCCECIGKNCINFGVNQSRCKKCPLEDVNFSSPEDL